MNIEFRNKSNKSAKIWLISMVAIFVYFLVFPPNENIWDSGQIIPVLLMVTLAISFWRFLWFYIKAKGYPSTVALIGVLFLSIAPIFIVFLIFLPDRFPIEY